MSSYVILRLAETFFRRWWLFTVPVVLLTGLGLHVARASGATYESTGTLYMERETFLSTLTSVRGEDIGWATPASYYDGQFNSLLGTETFISSVMSRADLRLPRHGSGQALVRAIRESISTRTSGNNLLHITAVGKTPEEAHTLAEAVVESFVQWQIDAELTASAAAQTVLDPLIDTYQDQVIDARRELDRYLEQNPEPFIGQVRPLAQQVHIDRLNDDISEAESRLADARSKRAEADLATAQTELDVRQRLRLIDAPTQPVTAEAAMRTAALTVAGFALVGIVLSLSAVVACTAADRSLRVPAEVEPRLGTELLAVVPEFTR